MFAAFTKAAWLLAKPSTLIVAALLLGYWLLMRGRVAAARRWFGGALAALLLCGLSPLGDWLIIPLEDRFPRPMLDDGRVDGIIVLGGAEDEAVAAARNVIAVNEAGGRYIEAAALARRFPLARVVFSGGGEPLSRAGETEAQSAARILTALGVAPQRLTLEDRSLTTWQNATFTARMFVQHSGERWLLVTSAWHMPRAMGAFRKAGLTVTAYPTDYRTTGRWWGWPIRSDLGDGLHRFDTVVREWPGLLVYWLTGRSTALFPGP